MIDRPVALTGGASLRVPMSYAEFVSLGETTHHEYYEGLCVVNPPNRIHVRAEMELGALLRSHCPPTHEVLLEWGWELGDAGPMFEPDILVVARDLPDFDLLRSAPLLVAEVLSPSTRDVDLGLKRRHYGAGGAAWYWVFDVDAVDLTVFENQSGELVEVQRIAAATPATTVGPFPVPVDPNAIVSA